MAEVRRNGHRDERADHRVRRGRRHGERGAEAVPGGEGRGAVVRHERRPPAGQQRSHVADRLGDRQVGGRIDRPHPVELEPEARAVGPPGVGAVADHERADARLAVRPDVEEPGALRRAHPLVAVARVVGGPEGAEVERDHPRARGRRPPARPRRARTARRTSRSIGRTRPVGLVTWSTSASRVRGPTRPSTASSTSSGSPQRKRHRRDDHPGAGAGRRRRRRRSGTRCTRGRLPGSRRPDPGRATGARCSPRSWRWARTRGRPASAPTKAPSVSPGLVEEALELPAQEPDGLALQPLPEARLGVQHGPGAGPVGAVVEEGDGGIERPEPTRTVRKRSRAPSSSARRAERNGRPGGRRPRTSALDPRRSPANPTRRTRPRRPVLDTEGHLS